MLRMSIIVKFTIKDNTKELNYKTNICCIHNCLCIVQLDKLQSNREKKSALKVMQKYTYKTYSYNYM